jgi:asparagine synthase (glutamine-hydrolysing)
MSAIAGLLRLDGEQVASRDLERMANSLREHGPDRSSFALAGQTGIVHCLMRISPEDRFDQQPLRGADGTLLTADLRLDNRDEILDWVGLSRGAAADLSDSRILLAAWDKFGNDVWAALRGAFAVAVWSPRNKVLTLARDHLGLNVVMWHRGKRFFAFASMPKGLFALGDVPREINEEKVADFLVLNHSEHSTTFYRNIFRVPPAHFVTIDQSGRFTAKQYWSTENIRPVRLPSDEAYAEQLYVHLNRAVRRQLRSASPVGSLLSAGLDSSAVAAVAAGALSERGQRLAAYTQIPRKGFVGCHRKNRYLDESFGVEKIKAAINNLDVTYIYNNECDDFAELDRVSRAFEYPVRNPTNLGWMLAISKRARAANQRVLLSGSFGNFTVSWDGWSQVSQHLLQGRLALAFQQYRAFHRANSLAGATSFRKLFIDPFWSERLLCWNDWIRNRGKLWRSYSAIRMDFAEEMQIESRGRAGGHDFRYRTRYGERAAGLMGIDYGGDWNAAIKAIHGVEIREPLADIDLVEYCLGVPDEQYLTEGIDRSLIRRAMWGKLPSAVLASRSRGVQSADWYEKLTAQRLQLKKELSEISTSALARRALDFDRLGKLIENWPSSGWSTRSVKDAYCLKLSRAVSMGRFLRWVDDKNR